jgi:hypothetical protein
MIQAGIPDGTWQIPGSGHGRWLIIWDVPSGMLESLILNLL